MPGTRLSMRKTREILRLRWGLGLAGREVARSVRYCQKHGLVQFAGDQAPATPAALMAFEAPGPIPVGEPYGRARRRASRRAGHRISSRSRRAESQEDSPDAEALRGRVFRAPPELLEGPLLEVGQLWSSAFDRAPDRQNEHVILAIDVIHVVACGSH